MTELSAQSLSSLAALIRKRNVSPVEVLEAHLKRIDQLNPLLNAIVTQAPLAMELALAAEAAIQRGDKVGPLHGVPLTIKDTIETKDLRTTSGSRVRAKYVPTEDAPVVTRLRNAGAIILGKTNVSEMAAAYDTENPVFGHANNPYDLGRTSGGSSGGEASAIAACLSPGGLGSDLMGSIRVPAHFCGIVGLKPTNGLVPSGGHIPDATGFRSDGAVIGPMARNVDDLSLLFRVIACLDTISHGMIQVSEDKSRSALRGQRVAWYAFDGLSPVTSETREAVEAVARILEVEGLEVREEVPPGIENGHDLWAALFARAAQVQMRTEYMGREDEAGPLIRYLLDSASGGKPTSQDTHEHACVERDRLRETLLEWMQKTPLIVAPTGATPAFVHGARKIEVGGHEVSIFRAFSYAQTYNVFGLPAISVPAGQTRSGLPIGIQIIGRPFAEELVLATARIVEQRLGGWKLPPLVASTKPTVQL